MTDATSPAAAPVLSQEEQDLNANMDAFFEHRLDDDLFVSESDPTPAAVEPEPAPAADPTPIQPTTNAEPAAVENAGDGEEPIDAGLLASLVLGTSPAPTPTPTAVEAPAPAPVESPAGDDDKPYMPLQAKRGMIPPQVLDTIFNSEDPGQREDALIGVLTSWGNAILAMADNRVKEFHAPRMVQAQAQTVEAQRHAVETQQDFYGAFPDLQEVPQLVARVAQVIAQQNPQAKYGPEMRDKIGKTARAFAKQTGITLKGAAPAAKVEAPQPFVTGSARPAPASSNAGFGPEDMLGLMDAGF